MERTITQSDIGARILNSHKRLGSVSIYIGAISFIEILQSNPSFFPKASKKAFLEVLRQLVKPGSAFIVPVNIDFSKWPQCPAIVITACALSYIYQHSDPSNIAIERITLSRSLDITYVKNTPNHIVEDFEAGLDKIRKEIEQSGALVQYSDENGHTSLALHIQSMLENKASTVFEKIFAQMFCKIQELTSKSSLYEEYYIAVVQSFRDDSFHSVLDKHPALAQMLLENVSQKAPAITQTYYVDPVMILAFHAGLQPLYSEQYLEKPERKLNKMVSKYTEIMDLMKELDQDRKEKQVTFPAGMDRAKICIVHFTSYIQGKLGMFPMKEVEIFQKAAIGQFNYFINAYQRLHSDELLLKESKDQLRSKLDEISASLGR